jgi:hypothetical protein
VSDELTSMAMLRSSQGMSAWGHSRPCRDDRLRRKAAVRGLRPKVCCGPSTQQICNTTSLSY